MVQEFKKNCRIAIIGGGPAGCFCAKQLIDAGISNVSIFDFSSPLRTLLPTGGGRCNLANAIYNFKELASNYPRGEKFLYSVFTKFATKDTLDFFKGIGVETYAQEDMRIFPTSNSSKEVRIKLLKSLKKAVFLKEKVLSIKQLYNGLEIKTNKASYLFDKVVIAIGGHSDFSILNALNINIVEPTKSLVALKCSTDFSKLSGVSLKNVQAKLGKIKLNGDVLFTHNGLSGPLIYKISSIFARKIFPFCISFRLIEDIDLQSLLNSNPHKEVKNLLAEFLPKSYVVYLLNELKINSEAKCHSINGKCRDLILSNLYDFKIEFIDKQSKDEVVTAGGVDLKQINSKTLAFKDCPNIYFCGEVLDIDGFCGGFNLQNCWSTAYVVANSIINY